MNSSKSVLVTGSTGFVGQQIINLLRRKQIPWLAAVRKPTDLFPKDKQVVVGEINGDTNWKPALENTDRVIHAAGRAHQNNVDHNAEQLLHLAINFHGTENLTRSAVAASVKKIIYLSTIKVLGESQKAPFKESDPLFPHDAYSEAKCKAETSLLEQTSGTQTQAVILRPPLVYGPHAKGNFQKVMAACAAGKILPLAGLKKNRRSFIYVKNLADAVVFCLNSNSTGNKIFHVADQSPLSTAEFIASIGQNFSNFKNISIPPWLLGLALDLMGKAPEKERLFSDMVVDTTSIQSTLGWNPPYTTQSGMTETALEYGKIGQTL